MYGKKKAKLEQVQKCNTDYKTTTNSLKNEVNEIKNDLEANKSKLEEAEIKKMVNF